MFSQLYYGIHPVTFMWSELYNDIFSYLSHSKCVCCYKQLSCSTEWCQAVQHYIQCFLLMLIQNSLLVEPREPYGMVVIKSSFATCKAKILHSRLPKTIFLRVYVFHFNDYNCFSSIFSRINVTLHMSQKWKGIFLSYKFLFILITLIL